MSDPSTRPSPVPAAPAAEGDVEAVVYRPLSLIAVVGAGLAGIYAVVIVLGGLVAFFKGDPWLLPLGTAVVPIAAAVLSFIGLRRIQTSEGTLAGEKVARWGLLLSVLVGLSYWAYVGATYFAISQEADRFSRAFVEKLQNRDVDSAFRLTLLPNERPPEDTQLRAQLEGRFNGVSELQRKGHLTTFHQSDIVRFFGQSGSDTQVESRGIDDWRYVGGGYQVRLAYRVRTTLVTFDLDVTLQGKEGKGSEGRQWQVLSDKTGIRMNPPPQMTPEGQRVFGLASDSRDYANREWIRFIGEEKPDEVYLRTLLPEQRERARLEIDTTPVGLLLADVVGLGALPCATPAAAVARADLAADGDRRRAVRLPGIDRFLAGSLVRADKDVFWAPEGVREEIIDLVRQQFHKLGKPLATDLMPESIVRVPIMRIDGDRFLVEHDIAFRVPATDPRYGVFGRLVLDCDAAQAQRGSVKAWRVRSVDLHSGKTIAAAPAAQVSPQAP